MALTPQRTAIKSGFRQTDIGVIPEDWASSKLGEFAFVTKLAGFEYTIHFDYSKSGPIIAIRALNIKDGALDLTEVHTIPQRTSDSLPRSKLTKGDLAISYVGTLGRVAVIPESDKFHLAPNVAKISVDKAHVFPEFLAHFLNSFQGQRIILEAAASTTQAALSMRNLREIVFSRPPLPEQHSIAQVLGDMDELIGMLDKLIAKKRDVKQAAMQQLLTGKRRLPKFDGGGDVRPRYKQTEVGAIPVDWGVGKLGQCLAAPPDYGINAAAVPLADKLPVYIRITDITEDGRFSQENLVSVEKAETERYFLNRGELVFARTGASVGKSYLYNPLDGRLVFAGFLIRVRPNIAKLIPGFLAAYVTTGAYWNWVKIMSMRSGQPGINSNEYAQLPIPLPTIEEQTAIAAILSDMDADTASLEARRDKTSALKQGMMQQLLTGNIRLK